MMVSGWLRSFLTPWLQTLLQEYLFKQRMQVAAWFAVLADKAGLIDEDGNITQALDKTDDLAKVAVKSVLAAMQHGMPKPSDG